MEEDPLVLDSKNHTVRLWNRSMLVSILLSLDRPLDILVCSGLHHDGPQERATVKLTSDTSAGTVRPENVDIMFEQKIRL